MSGDGASEVRQLSPEEIAELVAAGKITPVEQIRYHRRWGRISFPEIRTRGPFLNKYCWRDDGR